ncbi:uncharacterized protein LOC128884419 isoform X2 [Hylaeus volcanicus]|uniref:uncharacterized protein LOC128884419 isoform X2 n=1 Tax=Hylaeus volcanicus TaxID=313075 RepID=UPI0023B83D5A|nr:uncharacterized protein LOC128884419 isoform X2 [Hylaeus volcanicus]
MIYLLPAICLYIKLVEATNISSGFLMTLSYINGSSKNSSPKCLMRETFSKIPIVKSVSCTALFSENPAAHWYWFEDGTIRTKDNFCLTRNPSLASRTPLPLRIPIYLEGCSKNKAYRQQQWQHHENRFLPCHEKKKVADNIVQLSEWSQTTLIGEPISLLDKYNYQRPIDENSMRFIEARRFIPNDSEDIPRIQSYSQLSFNKSKELNSWIEKINLIVKDIYHDFHSTPAHIGRGAAFQIRESTTLEESATLLLPKFKLTPELLDNVEINNGVPLSVRASGYIVAPEDGNYSFFVSDLNSQLKLTVNGQNIINQWAAPLLGYVKSSPSLPVKQGDVLHVDISATGVMGLPQFTLKWMINEKEPMEEIPVDKISPSLLEPICPLSTIKRISCSTTFEKIESKQKVNKVKCPSGCLFSKNKIPPIYGSPGCYSLSSSVCMAAIHSGVISERGGAILIEIDREIEKAQYEGVPGFIIASEDGPADSGCGSVSMPVEDTSVNFLEEVEVVNLNDILNKKIVDAKWSGMKGIPTGYKFLLLGRQESNSNYITNVRLECDNSPSQNLFGSLRENSVEIGTDARLLYSLSIDKPTMILANMFLITSGSETDPLPVSSNWNRFTCQTLEQTISLYVQYTERTHEALYPSATIECETSFADLASPLSTFVVQCPRFCIKSLAPVIGHHTYAAGSSVCRSAIHAGVIAHAGGNVMVTRLPISEIVSWSSNRNGITSQKETRKTTLFTVDINSGRHCLYPENTGNLVHFPQSSPDNKSWESFRQKHQTIRPHNFSFSTVKKTNELWNFRQEPKLSSDSIVSSNIANETEHIANTLQQTTIKLEHYNDAIKLIESLIHTKLREIEQSILQLETELSTSSPKGPPAFSDYDKSNVLYNDWLVVDAPDAALGPSAWYLSTQTSEGLVKGLYQTSSIVSNTSYGSFLVYRHHSYNKGFISARFQLSDEGYGTFGFIVKYFNDKNFIALDISKVASGDCFISIRQMENGILSPPHNPVTYTLPTSRWIRASADFSPSLIRFFVNDGEVKTGLKLKKAFMGGYVGFLTRGLSSQTHVIWDTILCGPLWEESTFSLQNAFGSEYEKLQSITLSDNTTEVNPMFPLPVHHNITSIPSNENAFPTFNATTELYINDENMVDTQASEELILKHTAGCVSEMSDSLTSQHDEIWSPFCETPAPSTWLYQKSFLKGTSCSENNSAYLLLIPTLCTNTDFDSSSLSLKLKHQSKAGMIFRKKSQTDYFYVFVDINENTGPQVGIEDRNEAESQIFLTGTQNHLMSDVWYQLHVTDYKSYITVLLDNRLVLQVRTRNGNGGYGLIVERGSADFRGFQWNHPPRQ